MATIAKLKPEGTYEIFQDGQRVATGTESVLSQYGLSPTALTNEATTPSGQKVNPITGQIITSDMLGNTTPFNPVMPDFTPPSDISGLQPAEIKMTPQEEKQTSFEKRMADIQLSLAGKPAFEAEKRTEFGVAAAEQAYDDLNTQLRDLQRQQQLVPLTIQTQSEGRGRTEGGVEPLEIGKRRALAYDALTTSSLIDAAQGRLASAERKVIEAVNQKFAPQEAEYNALLKNLALIKNSPETTVQEMNRANKQEAIIKARQEATAKAKEQAKNILDWANKAAENMAKQNILSPENNLILNKIKNAKTENEAFTLAAPFLAEKDKLTGQSDFEQAFLRDKGRLPTVAELQAYKVSQEKPIIREFERNGHTIRQSLDPFTNKVILEVDLGAKEKGGLRVETPENQAQIIAYAQQYAADGKIPTGMPKEFFAEVAQKAMELPKQKGQIIDANTGVSPQGETTLTNAMSGISSAIELAKQLKELDKERIKGLIPALGGKIIGTSSQQRYVDLKSQIVDLLARARTGAVLTEAEEKFYGRLLPGRIGQIGFGLFGVNTQDRIDNFINNLSSDIQNKAAAKGWVINGLSKVNLGGKEYIVGQEIELNGIKGRVLPNGSIATQ